MSTKFKLPKKVKNAWLKALRSGKYKQGKGLLKDKIYNKYCCLGVACEIGLTKQRKPFCGITKQLVSKTFIPGYIQWHLATMNDRGVSFKRIANWIDKNL